jgi:hypothetical protein
MFKRCKRPPLARVARPLTLVFMAAAAALAGCSAPQPMSYLYGSRWLKAEMDTYDTFIVSVDGKGYIQDNRIWVDPGPHHIVFQTLPVHGFTRSPERALDVNIEPCMRRTSSPASTTRNRSWAAARPPPASGPTAR